MNRPILFSGPMVKAILEGRKTMTRRLMKPQPIKSEDEMWRWKDCQWLERGPGFPQSGIENYAPCKVDDVLWVRETWATVSNAVSGGQTYLYAVGGTTEDYRLENGELRKWRPSIHMPKEATRIFLRVTNVRVERLQEISIEDIAREALTGLVPTSNFTFRRFWDSLLKPTSLAVYGWAANPWVWVIGFERCEKPEGFLP